ESGLPLRIEGVPVRWSCPPELGQIDGRGVFRAAPVRTRGELTAEVAGTRVGVPVVIGAETRLMAGFETAVRWTGTTHTADVKGSVTTSGTSPHEGRQALRLEYDFSMETGTRAVYANGSVPLGRPLALHLWVRGDG